LKDYLNARQSEWSEKTYQGNLSSLTKHIAFLGPDMPVKSISHQDITNWSNYLKTRSPKLATASVARYQREARTFWYWLDKMDYNTQSPFRIKISSCIPDPCRVKAIATDDRDAMLYEAQQSGNNRDYAIMRFITDTGCRSGGVYRLRMENLNLEKKEAQIHEKGDKWHWVTFTEETAEAIRQWIEVRPDVDHDYVFTSLKDGRKLNPDSIYQLFQRVAERAGVEKNFNAHAWRHEVGQRYLRATGDPALARAKLNHSSVTVTLMYYANQDRDHLRDMTSKLSPTTPMQENNQ
jgi:integrase